MLYALRYIHAGELGDSRYAFGGLAAKLNHISIVLHLAVTENATLSTHHDHELRKHARRLARRRENGVDFYQLLSEENTEIERQVKAKMEKNRSKTQKHP